VPICTALYHEQLTCKALRYGTCERGSTQFYLPPTRLSTIGMNHACLYSQPHSVTGLWPVLIFRPLRAEAWLSWTEWLVTNRGGLPARRRSPIPVLTAPGGLSPWLARLCGIRCRTTREIRQSAETLSASTLRRFCSQCTDTYTALEVLRQSSL